MFLGFTETQKQQKTSRLVQKKRKRLFCRVCGSRISDMRYLTSVDGGSPNRVFLNPNGDLYEIITLSDSEGLQDTSPPILEETWFPGYPWVVLHCSSVCPISVGAGKIPAAFLPCSTVSSVNGWKKRKTDSPFLRNCLLVHFLLEKNKIFIIFCFVDSTPK